MKTATLLYSDAVLHYDFGPQHPLQPVRYKLTYDLMKAFGLLDDQRVTVVAPPEADDSQLQLVHSDNYIDAVKFAGQAALDPVTGRAFGLGPGDNPIFRGMHEVSADIVGGSIEGARRVLSGETYVAFNLAGGLHHAMPGRAAGFCVYNDPAAAIAWLLQNGADRVAYLDTDAHHGDGVQSIFYSDPRVLTISVHESGRYLFPGTGFVDEIGEGAGRGTAVNVPLEPGASDADLLLAVDAVAVPLIRAFQPDVLVVQHGCDAHRLDPLTHLECSINVFAEIARRERMLAGEVCNGRILVGGGGGYAYHEVVPRAWTSVLAALTGIELPDRLPEMWRCRTAFPIPDTLSDPVPGSDRPLESTKQTVLAVHRALRAG